MKVLSIFADESGDFGKYNHICPYYIISLVLHEQDSDISKELKKLNENLSHTEQGTRCVHMGPLIRREEYYRNLSVPERIAILRKVVDFTLKTDIRIKSFVIDKKHISDKNESIEKLSKQMVDFIQGNLQYFTSFDKINIYYDNGQPEVNGIFVAVFKIILSNVEFRKAFQKDYRLAQIADLACTAELIKLKMQDKNISPSERMILGSDRDIRKGFLRAVEKKRFGKN